jgi:peptide-methionine (S)-S-oxide reductase
MNPDAHAAAERPSAHATVAGGCFWCTEAVFEQVEGVHAVESGYIGGHLADPTYERVCDGDTGHAEAVRIAFDPDGAAVPRPARGLLRHARPHHPRPPGPRRRLAVPLRRVRPRRRAGGHARETIAELDRDGTFGAPIVTEVVELEHAGEAGVWYPAEAYHQGYFRANPRQGYCAAVIAPKLGKFRQRFAHRLRGAP